jgi:hypothetical protein
MGRCFDTNVQTMSTRPGLTQRGKRSFSKSGQVVSITEMGLSETPVSLFTHHHYSQFQNGWRKTDDEKHQS